MIAKLATSALIALLGIVVFAGAFDQLLGDDSKSATDTNKSENKTTVSAFGGGPQPLAETVQFLLTGPSGSTIATLSGNDSVTLPGRLNLATESTTARFRLTRSDTTTEVAYFGSLTYSARIEAVADFLETNAISTKITAGDLRDASKGVVTKFIFLPHRRPTEKWAGNFGTLTMGGVTSTQRAKVLDNLQKRGHMLAELQIVAENLATDDELPTFPAARTVRRTNENLTSR